MLLFLRLPEHFLSSHFTARVQHARHTAYETRVKQPFVLPARLWSAAGCQELSFGGAKVTRRFLTMWEVGATKPQLFKGHLYRSLWGDENVQGLDRDGGCDILRIH